MLNYFKKESLRTMELKAKEAMKQMTEGMSAEEIMAQIYVEGLEMKTEKQGRMMAQEAMDALAGFHRDYSLAKEDMGAFTDSFRREFEEGKSREENCENWQELLTAVRVLDGSLASEEESDLTVEELLKKTERRSFTAEEATPELEEKLREEALSALRESGLMYNLLNRQADVVEAMELEGITETVIRMGKEEMDYEGILTMIAYVNIKNGNIKEMPADMTIDQVAAAVAVSAEQSRIAEEVGRGTMAADVAAALIKILGVLVIARTALAAVKAGSLLAAGLFGPILFIPAMLVFWIGIGAAAVKLGKAWMENSRKIANLGTAAVFVPVSLIVKGFLAVVSFVRETLIPGVMERVKKAREMAGNAAERGSWQTEEREAEAVRQ